MCSGVPDGGEVNIGSTEADGSCGIRREVEIERSAGNADPARIPGLGPCLCDPVGVGSRAGMRRGGRLMAAVAALVVAGGLLSACAPSTSDTAASVARASGTGGDAGAQASAAGKPDETPVDIALPMNWVTDGMRRDGDGYALTLTATGRPGVYDAHFFHQAADGSVSGQQFLTVKVTGRDSLQVTWADGSVEPGTLALAEDGSPQTELALDPGCLAFLEPGRSQLDCRLYPKGEAAPSAGSSAAPSAAETLVAMPGTDEAMGYLCSVSADSLAHVTSKASDPFDTAVLQIALGQLEYDSGPIDGVYGRQTRAAVLAYQQAASLTVDGLVGPRTWTSLQADACRVGQDPAQ